MSDKITVLIIDDSFFMRKFLTELLESDARIKVIGTAKNGKQGLEKIKELRPKAVTLDYEMPGWNGIETLRHIMRESPAAVIMLSAFTKEDAEITLQALREGAVDYVLKPSGPISWDIGQIKYEIIKKVKAASLIDIAKLKEIIRKKAKKLIFGKEIPLLDKAVVIGASTGGPQTLELILKQFPQDIPSAILIVQHMPKFFTKLFAERLNSICDIQVKEAEQGEIIKKGIAYVAPGSWHMRVKSKASETGIKIGVIKLTKESPVDNLRPSINVLMKSVAKEYKDNAIGVILTGMGQDGAEGISAINEAGGATIAQDEESSLIFGMPKRAIETGAVRAILSVDKIARRILELLAR
ncbi:MAG: chemotaxis response regulator protein-glutamate methylesterase [Minisyncoccales bacterium]